MLMVAKQAARITTVRRLAVLLVLVVALFCFAIPGTNDIVRAASNCQITSVSPASVPDGSDDGFAFNIVDNTDNIAWVDVAVPSHNVVITSANSDWLPNTTINSYDVGYSGNPVSAGTGIEVDAEATVSFFSPPASWVIEASTDPNGSNPFTCSGSSTLTVTSTTPPRITNISANAQATSATVSWSTDSQTTGRVDYGKTPAYGSNQNDSQLASDHQITLSGLTPATIYHYYIAATDQAGNTATSIDSTFFTASVPTNTTEQPGSTTGTILPPVTTPADRTPPAISLTTSLPHIVTFGPTVGGIATDNISVAKVEYSTDGGKDWLPVDTANGLGSKSVNFSFKPVNLLDGTFVFVARAIDGADNIATSNEITVILDTMPPAVGGSVIALGPQVLLPDNNGVITTLPNVSSSIYLSATGGATSVDIHAYDTNMPKPTVSGSFTLHQTEDNGLWTGALSFSTAGDYQLVAEAVDGANNTTRRTIGNISVIPPAAVLSTRGTVANATISIYCLDSDSNSWVEWDGAPYSQTNPLRTNSSGHFSLMLPPGTYYAHVDANGYTSVNSASFTLRQPTPLAAAFYLTSAPGFGSLHVPLPFNFAVQPVNLRSVHRQLPAAFMQGSLIGTSLKNLLLMDTTGATQNSISWLGKPTVISVASDWAPAAAEETAALEQLTHNSDINVKVIGLQEDSGKLKADNAITGSQLVWLADPNSKTLPVLPISTVPVNYFIDRKGIIQSVTYGPASYQQLLNTIVNLP